MAWKNTKPKKVIFVKHACLENWKERRKDKKTEEYWSRLASKRLLTPYELYQKEWNFIETDYGERPSNNGLDLGNPGFAFSTNLQKYIVIREVEIDISHINHFPGV